MVNEQRSQHQHPARPDPQVPAQIHSLNRPTGLRIITVTCPYCRRVHCHVWPAGLPQPGPRMSHCFVGWYDVLAPLELVA